jgi:putative membrane protein
MPSPVFAEKRWRKSEKTAPFAASPCVIAADPGFGNIIMHLANAQAYRLGISQKTVGNDFCKYLWINSLKLKMDMAWWVQGLIYMKTHLPYLTLIACLTAFSLASAPTRAADTVSAGDKTFVMKAAQGGMTEVQLGQLAADKATSQDVKDFGSKMVTDHGKANDELKSIAGSKGITLPDKLDAKHQAMVDKMNGLSGAAFDKAYVDAMVGAHKKDNALFTQEASSGQDADIKAFAAKTDETVKMHLSMIQDIQSKMK